MKLKLAELTDLCLVELYDLAQAKGQVNTQPISDIVCKFRIDDAVEPAQVARYLESKMCLTIATSSASTDVCITRFGMTTVRAGGETGLISQYRQEPELFLESQLRVVTSLVYGCSSQSCLKPYL